MTSFAFPPTMAAHQFDPYAGEAYGNFASTTQSYPAGSFAMESSFPAALSTIDSFSAVNAFSDAPRSQDHYNFGLNAAAADVKASRPYSPAASPMDHLPPPQLSASSESGASVHSTSSSAMGSPHMNPSYPADEWTMIPGHGLGLPHEVVSQETFTQPFFSSSIEQDAMIANDKLQDFVGESTASLHMSSNFNAPNTPSSASFQSSPSPVAAFGHPGSAQQLPSVPVLRSQNDARRSSVSASPRRSRNEIFKTPMVPASAMLPSSPRRLSPPRTPYYDQGRRSSLPGERRNSLLSNQLFPPTGTPPLEAPSGSFIHSPQSYQSPVLVQASNVSLAPTSQSSCSFPAPPHLCSSGFRSTSTTSGNATLTSDFLDPSILNPQPFHHPMPFAPFPDMPTGSPHVFQQPPSPAPSNSSAMSQNRQGLKASPAQSPYLGSQRFHPYAFDRRASVASNNSYSQSSQRSASFELDDEAREKGQCPIPECGRVFKDLKAHMLTHLTERPEKCPIQTCEYHIKGFARKYDKNRHTLTHYKGTMVCGFCPGSGSAAEKSFNRADVFKRHLTSVHGVEQTPPNSRRKSPSGRKLYGSAAESSTAGTCSTCGVTFANAQDFYEHLDDCVLRVVQQIDPSEDINQKHLSAMNDDKKVQETLDRHGLSSDADYTQPQEDEEDEDEDEEEIDNDDANDSTYGSRNPRSGKGTIKGNKKNSS